MHSEKLPKTHRCQGLDKRGKEEYSICVGNKKRRREMAWTWADCDDCHGAGLRGEEGLCPICKGYGMKPIKAMPLDMGERFRTKAAAWRWIEKNS